MDRFHTAAHVMTALMLASAAEASQTLQVQSPAARLAPNYTYDLRFQNPGAPDQLLLDAPDSVSDRQPVRIAVRNNTILLQRSAVAASEPSRNATSLSVNVNLVPFDFFSGSPPAALAECVVDFNDAGALTLSEPSLWFDRIYLPWFQNCNGGGYVDMRPLVYEHFHLGYEDPHVAPCFSHPQAYPSILQDDESCDFVDVPTEPRTHLTSHEPFEYIWIRMYGNNGQWAKFSLNQLRVPGVNAVRVCYRKDQEIDLDWLTSGEESGTVPGIWLCWSELSPGAWDLSNWVWDVTDVKITGADHGAGPFSLDDLKFGVQ
jgi:hypothetical protein